MQLCIDINALFSFVSIRSLSNATKFYKQIDNDITNEIQQRINVYVLLMLTSDYIDEKLQRFLVQSQAKPGRFYIFPKLYKAGNPGSPRVSSNGHSTEHIFEFVYFFLKPLITKLPSHIITVLLWVRNDSFLR